MRLTSIGLFMLLTPLGSGVAYADSDGGMEPRGFSHGLTTRIMAPCGDSFSRS